MLTYVQEYSWDDQLACESGSSSAGAAYAAAKDYKDGDDAGEDTRDARAGGGNGNGGGRAGEGCVRGNGGASQGGECRELNEAYSGDATGAGRKIWKTKVLSLLAFVVKMYEC
jgi:hypothetical protein